jgi:hypothetical protein
MEKLFRLDGDELREFTAEEYAQYQLDQLEKLAEESVDELVEGEQP